MVASFPDLTSLLNSYGVCEFCTLVKSKMRRDTKIKWGHIKLKLNMLVVFGSAGTVHAPIKLLGNVDNKIL